MYPAVLEADAAGVPLVVTVAVALSMFPLPSTPNTVIFARPSEYPLSLGMPLAAPPGWTCT